MRFAFYGRVATDDAQDPSLSIPRQLAACKSAIEPAGGDVVTHYWDVESGRKGLDQRGKGDGAGLGVSVPREGGLTDLIDATANGRIFDAVIVESIDRLSRMTADATHIERQLEQRDIGLFAADEPTTANATAILTRRVKQGVSEWYVRDLIEKSRRGMEESARQGWHTGGPVPYGYRLDAHPHPNPHKAREGKKKHRLLPDPVQAPIVAMIFEDYCLHGMGLGEICDKLNRDLARYPPPKRNRKDEMPLRQTWSRSQVQAMLRNPKYTGYNVWGATTSVAGARSCARASKGSGARHQSTSRSSPRRYSSSSRSAPGETRSAPSSHRSTTHSDADGATAASTSCAAASAARCAAGA